MIDYALTRSKRKTIAIYITKDAVVEVRAPLKVPKAEINRFVASKEDWIRKHLAAREESLHKKAAFSLDYGGSVIIRGREYPLTARDGNRAGFDGEQVFMPPGLTPEEIIPVMVRVYRLVAKAVLTEKAAIFAKQMCVMPTSIKINGAKTRWGSCSGVNSINFSWRLIMAEDDVIDYVVVHELAHIREHNHSKRFWAIVDGIIPDYAKKRARLKELQKKLAGEDWE